MLYKAGTIVPQFIERTDNCTATFAVDVEVTRHREAHWVSDGYRIQPTRRLRNGESLVHIDDQMDKSRPASVTGAPCLLDTTPAPPPKRKPVAKLKDVLSGWLTPLRA